MDTDKRKTQIIDGFHITVEEKRILEIIRKIDYGEVRVIVTGGKPLRIEEIKKSIKL